MIRKPLRLLSWQYIGYFLGYVFLTFFLFVLAVQLGEPTTRLVRSVFSKDTHLSTRECAMALVLAVTMTSGWCFFFLCWKNIEKKCQEEETPSSGPIETKARPSRPERRHEARPAIGNNATKDVVVPLIGTFFSLTGATLSAVIMWYGYGKTADLGVRIKEMEINQAINESNVVGARFTQDAERQYVAMIYSDLMSGNAKKQSAAISLVKTLLPQTGAKLLGWFQDSGYVDPANQEKLERTKNELAAAASNGAITVFVHSKIGDPPSAAFAERLKGQLGELGFRVMGAATADSKMNRTVEYTNDRDRSTAEALALKLGELEGASRGPFAVLNTVLKVQNPRGFIGVWL